MAAGTDGRVKLQLGEHEYTAVPQRIGYLQHTLGPRLGELAEGAAEGGKNIVGRQAYELLKALLPKQGFMPEHEFMGFGSKEAYEAEEYDSDLDCSPTVPEVIEAVKKSAMVNGGDAVDFLRQLLGPEMIGKLIALVVANMAEASTPSLSSPPTNGASAQTSSGAGAQTLPETTPPA